MEVWKPLAAPSERGQRHEPEGREPCGHELDDPDEVRQPGLQKRARHDWAHPVGRPEAGAEKREVGAAQPLGSEVGGQGVAGDLEDHLGQREEAGEGDEYPPEGLGQEQRRRGGSEEGCPDEQRAHLRAPVYEVGDRELQQDDHDAVAAEEQPYLPVRDPDEVPRVDRERLPVLREDVVQQHP